MVLDQLLQIRELNVTYNEFSNQRFNLLGSQKDITALEDINLRVQRGENIAILGRNGAGKSTLLKCIAGFLRPSKGEIITKGRIMLLAGTNPGFQRDITGRENIRLLAPLYGVDEGTIDNFVEDIEEFTQLGEALDRSYKGYSSGMKGKIGFGFMTGLSPDVLLIDETLGVGDLEFRAKAQLRLKDFINRSGSVLMSTHSLGLAAEMCTRGVLLDLGRTKFEGEISECIEKYRQIIS